MRSTEAGPGPHAASHSPDESTGTRPVSPCPHLPHRRRRAGTAGPGDHRAASGPARERASRRLPGRGPVRPAARADHVAAPPPPAVEPDAVDRGTGRGPCPAGLPGPPGVVAGGTSGQPGVGGSPPSWTRAMAGSVRPAASPGATGRAGPTSSSADWPTTTGCCCPAGTLARSPHSWGSTGRSTPPRAAGTKQGRHGTRRVVAPREVTESSRPRASAGAPHGRTPASGRPTRQLLEQGTPSAVRPPFSDAP